MKHIWMLLLFLVPSGIFAGEQSERSVLSLSLKRAVELALSPQGNVQIRLSAEALKQAESRSAQARSALLPNIDASLAERNQTANLKANGMQFNVPGIPGFSFPSLVGPFSVFDARISGTQSVFDFSSIRRLKASHAGISAAEAEITSAEEQVAARVARAYLLAVRADADVETAQANITLSQALLNLAENQKKAGTATGIEITRARVQLANDRQRLLIAENARRSAHLKLLRVMDKQLDMELVLTDKLGYVPVDSITLDRARKQAWAERPDLEAQQEREESARLAASAIKMERLPSLAAFGDYGSIGPGVDESRPTRTIGVTLKIPLFDSGRRNARHAESEAQYRTEQARTKDLKNQIELDVRLALDALHSAEEQVKVAREGLQLSESELAQAQRRYDAGVSYSLEITDAQTRLQRAQDNQTQALYSYNVARIDLELALGKARSSGQ
jgi:outer membrane protein